MKEKLFIDTDLGGDCDDVGALALANIFKNKGLIDIVGMTHTTSMPYGAGCIDLINEYYGNAGIKVGATRREGYCSFDTNQYAQKMLHDLGNSANTREKYPNSVKDTKLNSNASPKTISGRTSYHGIRLEFHH